MQCMGENHAFIDPNIWYDEQELRKQIEQFAGCFILTAQEAPETARRIREDLYKKTMSADGIAGRRPYGYVTRMIELVGWKRMEVNRLMHFKGVSEHNFPSILRRSFIWRPHARFVCRQFLEENYQDSEKDGYFPKDPTLKDFLVSGPAIASSLQLQHAFEHRHSREDCLHMIESYCNLGGDQGLTEDKMRIACGLQPRRRETISAPGLGPVDSASQDEADETRQGLLEVLQRIVEELLSKGPFAMTFDRFKRLPLSAKAPNLDKENMVKQLENFHLVKEICRSRGKGRRCIIPNVMGSRSLLDSIDLKNPAEPSPLVFPENWHISGLRQFASGYIAREHNVITMIAYYDSCATASKRRGSGTYKAEVKAQQDVLTEKRRKMETVEQLIGKFLASTAKEEPAQRIVGKQQWRQGKVKYRAAAPDLIRGRKYVCGLGVQQCTRKLLKFVCPQTTDLAA